MRVALVVAGPFPALRGSQVLVGHLADGLRARGHVVTLITHGRRLADRPGPSVRRVFLDLGLVARLLWLVRREAIDVLHAHNYEGAIAALLVGRVTRRPVVYHGHSAMADELPTYATRPWVRSILRRIGATLDRHVPRRADHCVAVTDTLADVLRGAGVAQAALSCIEPVVVPDDLGMAGDAQPVAEPLVCYAGNLDGYQNIELLLTAFAEVRACTPEARLRLITHADAARAAERLADRGPTAGVELVRVETYGQVREALAEAAVAVSPRAEASGFPMKLLNYMAAGKAIVAARGSAKGLRDGVNARVVDDDPQAFASAIVALLRDPKERARLGAAARSAVASPEAWAHVLDRLEAIYTRVTAAAQTRIVPTTMQGVNP